MDFLLGWFFCSCLSIHQIFIKCVSCASLLGIILGHEEIKIMQLGFLPSGSTQSRMILALFYLFGALADAVNQVLLYMGICRCSCFFPCPHIYFDFFYIHQSFLFLFLCTLTFSFYFLLPFLAWKYSHHSSLVMCSL